MTFREYISEMYPIEDKLRAIASDPYTAILENDDLPYDDIRMVDGVLQKVVEISSDSYISIMELLSYDAADVEKMKDEEFKQLYYAYMDNVEVSPLTLERIMSSVREVRKHKEAKKELLSRCTE